MSARLQAAEAWGDAIPVWVITLATECDASSQKAAASRIGYSPAVVNTVLKHTYKGDLIAVEKAVRGALLDAKVDCPVLGELPAHTCLEKQRQPYAGTNAMRVRLYRACRNGCQHSRHKQGER